MNVNDTNVTFINVCFIFFVYAVNEHFFLHGLAISVHYTSMVCSL